MGRSAPGALPRWLLLAAGAAALAACGGRAAPVPPSVIPQPERIEARGGAFLVSERTRIVAADGTALAAARRFAELLRRSRGWSMAVDAQPAAGDAAGTIEFALGGDAGDPPESYAIDVGPGGATVSASDPRGLYYGAVTLWQWIGAGAAPEVPLAGVAIRDAPRFRWRGLMLDSARHYQSPEFIESLIDWMALHKLNVLHWHLTDDQAWRLEIRAYPRLTEVGAWRVPAGAASREIDPGSGKPRRYGGYYSQDTVRRLVRYAAERHVTIVPEIEMPGHATAALVAYPPLAVDGRAPAAVPADWGVYPNLFNVEEETFAFIEDVLREVMTLFPGEYIHVGGDEVVKEQWESSPRVRRRMRELGVADGKALQAYFIARIGRFLSAHGRRLVGWDEILEGGLPPDATVMSWRGIDGAVAAAAAGHDAILSPWPVLYFDHRQGGSAAEPPGRGRIVRLEDVYDFDPLPAALAGDRRRHVLGLQANVWTEHVRTEARVEWMTIPRAAALAEVAWSVPERRDVRDFRRRLESATAWYRALGYRPADTAFREPPALSARLRRSQELRTCAGKLVLNLEDDAPAEGERAVFLVDILEPCWIFEDADLTGVRSLVARVGQFPFNFQIGKDRDSIRLRPPRDGHGELEVRIGGCDGERIASLPLAPAQAEPGVTRLPPAPLTPRDGSHDLCFQFSGRSVDPMWAIDSVELVP